MNTREALAGLARRMADAGWIEKSLVTETHFEFKFTEEGREKIAMLAALFHDLGGLTAEELVALFMAMDDLAERAGL